MPSELDSLLELTNPLKRPKRQKKEVFVPPNQAVFVQNKIDFNEVLHLIISLSQYIDCHWVMVSQRDQCFSQENRLLDLAVNQTPQSLLQNTHQGFLLAFVEEFLHQLRKGWACMLVLLNDWKKLGQ